MQCGETRGMASTRCSMCGFHVTPEDAFCPDCGLYAPAPGTDTEGIVLQTKLELAFVALMVGSLVTAGALISYLGTSGLFGAIGAIGAAGWTGATLIRRADVLAARRHHRSSCLQHTEAIARKRLDDIEARKERLEEAWNAVEAQDHTPRWQGVRAALQEGLASVNRQSARYRVTLWEIALIRWENRMEPLVDGAQGLGYDECEGRQAAVAAVRDAGRAMLQEWQSIDVSGDSRGERCLDRLRASLAACDELHQELVARQAMLALRGVKPSREVEFIPGTPTAALGALGRVDARIAAVSEVCSAFTELEDEYRRMRSEERAAASVEAVLGRR